MKSFLFALLISVMPLTLAATNAADEPAKKSPQEAAAIAYFQAYLATDLTKINSVVAVPFSFVGFKKVITKMDELKKTHQELFTAKGKRDVPKYTIVAPKNITPLDPKVFKAYETIGIQILSGKHKGDKLHVHLKKIGKEYKVIGIAQCGHPSKLPSTNAADKTKNKMRSNPSREVGIAYFEALMTGNVKKANSLVAVPYSLDGTKILETIAEVKAIHAKIVAQKGKRAIPKYRFSWSGSDQVLNQKKFGRHDTLNIKFSTKTSSKNEVEIYVKKIGKEYKVIGVQD